MSKPNPRTKAAVRYAANRCERLYNELPDHQKDPYPVQIRKALADAFDAGKRQRRRTHSPALTPEQARDRRIIAAIESVQRPKAAPLSPAEAAMYQCEG